MGPDSPPDQDSLRRFYDKWSEGPGWLELNYGHPLFLKTVIRRMPVGTDSRVVDVGCGTGWTCRQLARRAPEGKVVGVDISEGLVRRARKLTHRNGRRACDNVEYLVANAESIPLPDDSFDFALAMMTFTWWVDPDKVLKEIHRVLKPAGRLFVADIYDKGLAGRSARIWNRFLKHDEKVYTERQYADFLGSHFPLVRQEKIGRLWGLLSIGTKA